MKIFYGDNTVASRNALLDAIQQAKSHGIKDIVELNGKKINIATLTQAIESHSLFDSPRLVYINELLTRPKSKEKDVLLKYLQTVDAEAFVLLWESKPITPAQKKLFSNAELLEFKLSKYVFTFLDTIHPQASVRMYSLYQKALVHDSLELLYALLIRRIRLLIQIKENAPLKMPAWQMARLKKQAGLFSIQNLLSIHGKLLQIDIDYKTGASLLSLKHELDRLILSI